MGELGGQDLENQRRADLLFRSRSFFYYLVRLFAFSTPLEYATSDSSFLLQSDESEIGKGLKPSSEASTFGAR
jgi:hypothetical protein